MNRNFSTLEEFVGAKFGPKSPPLTLLTSMSEETIGGENAVLVLAARAKEATAMIGEALGTFWSARVKSESSPTFASVAVLRYRHNWPIREGGANILVNRHTL